MRAPSARALRALVLVLLLGAADAASARSARRYASKGQDLKASPTNGRLDLNEVYSLQLRLQGGIDRFVPLPSRAGEKGVTVRFDLAMNKLLSLDTTAGVVEVSVFYRLMWNDERLAFNGTEEFGDMWDSKSFVHMNDSHIWTPDVVPYYSTDYSFETYGCGVYDSTFLEENGWNVLWSRPGQMSVQCDSELYYFPFDTQRCSLVVGPWLDRTYNFYALHEGNSSNPFGGDMDSEEWEVQETRMASKTRLYINGRFPEVHYTIKFRRFPHFYMVNAVLPMAMVVILSLLTLWIPIENGSGERLGFSVTLLLTIMATAIFTAEFRPATREDTWMDRFQAYCMLLTFLPVLESVLVVWLQYIYEKVSKQEVAGEGEEDENPPLSPVSVGSKPSENRLSRQSSMSSISSQDLGGSGSPRAGRSRLSRFTRKIHGSSVVKDAKTVLRADFRMRMVVFVMHKVPSLEWLITGRRGADHWNPRAIDMWCRHCLSVVALVAAGHMVSEMPEGWLVGTSIHMLVPPITMGLILYASTALLAVVFLILRVAILCSERQR